MEMLWRDSRAQMFLQMTATMVVGFVIWRLSYFLGSEASWNILREIDPTGILLPVTGGIALLTGLPCIVGLPVQGVLRERIAASYIPLLFLTLLGLTVYHALLRNNYRP